MCVDVWAAQWSRVQWVCQEMLLARIEATEHLQSSLQGSTTRTVPVPMRRGEVEAEALDFFKCPHKSRLQHTANHFHSLRNYSDGVMIGSMVYPIER